MNKRGRLILGFLFALLLFVKLVSSVWSSVDQLINTSQCDWVAEKRDGRLMISSFRLEDPPAALHTGDEVISVKINGETQPAKVLSDINDGTLALKPGSEYSLVIKCQGDLHELPLKTRTTAPGRWIAQLIRLFIPLSFLLTGLAVFLLRPMDKQAVMLALLLGTFTGLFQFGNAAGPLWMLTLAGLASALGLFFLPVFLHFFLLFPERSKLLARFSKLEWWLYVPFSLTLLWFIGSFRIEQTLRTTFEWIPRSNWFNTICVSLALAYLLGGLLAMIAGYRTTNPEARKRLRVVMAGSGLGFLNIFLLILIEAFDLKDAIPGLRNTLEAAMAITLPLIPLSFAYAIVRHKVIPVSLILRRGVRYVLVSRGSVVLEMILVTIVMAVFLLWFFEWMFRFYRPATERQLGLVVGLISAAVGILTWILSRYLHKRFLAPVIDRRFFRQSYNAQRVLSELAQSLRTTTNLAQLLEQVTTKIHSALQPANVTILLRDEASGDFITHHSVNYNHTTGQVTEPATRLQLPDSGEAVRQLERGCPVSVDFDDPNSPLLAHNGHSNNGAHTMERATLEQLNSELLLPLAAKSQILGIISLGPRLGDLPYSGEDERLLMSVAGPATFAVENARLVERMVADARRRQELEAENAQRAKELEEARQLQLSMLPRDVPQLPNLEIAAYMKTATEVGGDYYDFHMTNDGTLTVAVGDATGHGLRAGTVVTATKSLFNNLATLPDLTEILRQASRSLKQMNLRSLFMAMTMLRLKGSDLTISVAGMPPVLIYRAASGKVEEIALRGLPLGSVTNYSWKQQHLAVASGDVIAVMSDGFPERFNDEGEILGFDQAAEILQHSAELSSQQIINRFIEAGDAWGNARPQDDDVTFVVIKVK